MFKKSSMCCYGTCVEIDLDYKKSSMCGIGTCVEVATKKAGIVAVRDSKNPEGAVLYFSNEEWSAFIGGVKNKEFDL